MDDSLNRLTADMDRFLDFEDLFQEICYFFRFLGRSLVVEGSLRAPKVTAWGPGLDFL